MKTESQMGILDSIQPVTKFQGTLYNVDRSGCNTRSPGCKPAHQDATLTHLDATSRRKDLSRIFPQGCL